MQNLDLLITRGQGIDQNGILNIFTTTFSISTGTSLDHQVLFCLKWCILHIVNSMQYWYPTTVLISPSKQGGTSSVLAQQAANEGWVNTVYYGGRFLIYYLWGVSMETNLLCATPRSLDLTARTSMIASLLVLVNAFLVADVLQPFISSILRLGAFQLQHDH